MIPNQTEQRDVRRRQVIEQLTTLRTTRPWRRPPPRRRMLPTRPLVRTQQDNPGLTRLKENNPQDSKPNLLQDTKWLELLFGPRGVVTAVFHILDDRRKFTETTNSFITGSGSKSNNDNGSNMRNSETTDSYHLSDLSLLPDFLISAKPIDFTKIFESFLTGSRGDFDERISNLPEILGICNRLSCGDIYKAIDEFRKSEFFINFQTALQLIQDPKGWEILGDIISNPDLIVQIINGAGENGSGGDLKHMVKTITDAGISRKINTKEIGPEDGDLGTDFSKMVQVGGIDSRGEFSKLRKPTAEELPEIAENIDAIDYYNAVD